MIAKTTITAAGIGFPDLTEINTKITDKNPMTRVPLHPRELKNLFSCVDKLERAQTQEKQERVILV